MLDGRVKTLHPKVHGGLLARRDLPEHMAAIKERASSRSISSWSISTRSSRPSRKPDCTLEDAIENIDIGGPTMVRAAAKNHRRRRGRHRSRRLRRACWTRCAANDGALGAATRFALAKKAFAHTAAYDERDQQLPDGARRARRSRALFPDRLTLQFEKVQPMRYGENPHQAAAFYRDADAVAGSLARYAQLQGKELSYNNIADADAAWECVKTFDAPACVIVKHANPCGVADGRRLPRRLRRAHSRPIPPRPSAASSPSTGRSTARPPMRSRKQFVEVLIAPDFDARARARCSRGKPNVRVLEVPLAQRGANATTSSASAAACSCRRRTRATSARPSCKVVTRRSADRRSELHDLLFAWRVAKFVKSNAIVFCGDGMTLGVGAGQMSRVDSARIAAIKAQNAGLSLAGSVVASDAFFPFRDGLDVVADAGAKAVIQPGGSMRDDEVIAAADEHGLAMVFTGVRHFRH